MKGKTFLSEIFKGFPQSSVVVFLCLSIHEVVVAQIDSTLYATQSLANLILENFHCTGNSEVKTYVPSQSDVVLNVVMYLDLGASSNWLYP